LEVDADDDIGRSACRRSCSSHADRYAFAAMTTLEPARDALHRFCVAPMMDWMHWLGLARLSAPPCALRVQPMKD